jgi:hypothetical protein
MIHIGCQMARERSVSASGAVGWKAAKKERVMPAEADAKARNERELPAPGDPPEVVERKRRHRVFMDAGRQCLIRANHLLAEGSLTFAAREYRRAACDFDEAVRILDGK